MDPPICLWEHLPEGVNRVQVGKIYLPLQPLHAGRSKTVRGCKLRFSQTYALMCVALRPLCNWEISFRRLYRKPVHLCNQSKGEHGSDRLLKACNVDST